MFCEYAYEPVFVENRAALQLTFEQLIRVLLGSETILPEAAHVVVVLVFLVRRHKRTKKLHRLPQIVSHTLLSRYDPDSKVTVTSDIKRVKFLLIFRGFIT